jgi:hypothetical protein
MWGYPVFRVPTEALGPPRERLQTRKWGQLFGAPLGYLELFTRQLMVDPREVPEPEVRERPPTTPRHSDPLLTMRDAPKEQTRPTDT